MQYEAIGHVVELQPVSSGTSARGREWRKQTFVIETTEARPVKMAFELFGDNIEEYAKLVEPHPDSKPEIVVKYAVESFASKTGKYYTTCTAFYVRLANAAAAVSAQDVPEAEVEEVNDLKTVDELRQSLTQAYGVNKR